MTKRGEERFIDNKLRGRKQPTGLWKLFQEMIDIMHEAAMQKKAIRCLVNQKWSVEFLVYLCVKARAIDKKGVMFTLKNKDGQELIITAATPDPIDYAGREEKRKTDIEAKSIHALMDEDNANARRAWETRGGY